MTIKLIASVKHSWSFGICQNCGIAKETIKGPDGSFFTVYKKNGKVLIHAPVCGGLKKKEV